MSSVPSQFISSRDKKIGIIAGGQLGKLLCLSASNLDVEVSVMDGSENAPAKAVCQNFVLGNYANYEDVYRFGKTVDLLTLELEHVNIDALLKLKQEGLTIFPDPEILKTIQDKGLQKAFFKAKNLPSSSFQLVKNKAELEALIDKGIIDFPFVQKSRKGGYDGKGVALIKNRLQLSQAFDTASVIEQNVEIEKELSVILCRDQQKNIQYFEPVEMVFNADGNLVEKLISPAQISDEIKKQSIELSKQIMECFDLVGLLAVELFLTKQGTLLINEVAPRPHNSGHHTIEANLYSQYDLQMRAVLNLPLPQTKERSAAVMLNILGADQRQGHVEYKNIDKCIALQGVYFHIYGKKITKPFRKMGHITILDDQLENALEKADYIQKHLIVEAT